MAEKKESQEAETSVSALEVLTVHRESFVLVVPSSHKLAKRKRVRLDEVSGENFVMNERSYAPGFYDLIFGMLRDARVVPNVSQTAAEISTVISLVVAHGHRHSARIGDETQRCFGNRLRHCRRDTNV